MQKKGQGHFWRNENLFLRIDERETMRDIVIVNMTWTLLGDLGGSLKDAGGLGFTMLIERE
jgi:hypothetical protein